MSPFRAHIFFANKKPVPDQGRVGFGIAGPGILPGQAYLPGWYPRYHPGSRANVRPYVGSLSRALSPGETPGVLPAAGVTVSQTGRAYWRGHVVRGNPNDTASQRSNGGSGAIFAVWPGARSHRTGFALPGISTATRLRRCLYLNKCMTSHRNVPRDCRPH